MLTYYVLVMIQRGLLGGVVSWAAIPTFFSRRRTLSTAVAVPRSAAAAAAITLMTSLVVACWFYLKRLTDD